MAAPMSAPFLPPIRPPMPAPPPVPPPMIIAVLAHERSDSRRSTTRDCETVRRAGAVFTVRTTGRRSEEHTSELQSQSNLVCRLLLEKKNKLVLAPVDHRH